MARGGGTAIGTWLGIAAAVVALDQATKFAVERAFAYGERLAIVPGFFDLTLVYNRGAAFSFLANAAGWQRWFFIGLGAVAAAFIVWLLARHGSQRLFAFALALILGGAIGNVVDRIVHGHVVDFVLLHWQRHFFPAFNVADSAITVGAVLLVVDELRRVRRHR
jgi:signal peptidase II